MAGGGPPRSPETARLRAAHARNVQIHGADSPQAAATKSALATQVLGEYIKRTLASAPPLTCEQRARLAELLAPVRRNAAGTETAGT